MKDQWQDKSRLEKIAATMFPGLVDEKTRQEMLAANPEQKAGLQKRFTEGDKLYGKPSPPSVDYSKVPHLKRR